MYAAPSRVVSTPRFTDADIEKIAIQLKRIFNEVNNVYVFGGEGDASATIILTTADESLVEGFVCIANEFLSRSHLRTLSVDQVRFAAFKEVCLGFTTWLNNFSSTSSRGAYFDILIFPKNWKERVVELEKSYYHPVPYFLRRISSRSPLFVA